MNFEGMSEKQAGEKILSEVEEYCDKYHSRKAFGEDSRIDYVGRVYDKAEIILMHTGYRTVGELENTDNIMTNSFWIGVYPGMTCEMIDYMANTIKNYFDREHCNNVREV